MLYILEHTDQLNEDFLSRAMPLLTAQRTEQINRYRSFSDKINGSAAFLLLCTALREEFGILTPPCFRYRERGKPYLDDREDIFFNLSHCKNAAACIVSESNTAVDIMDIRNIKNNIVHRVCSDSELEKLNCSEHFDRDFIRLWTKKECYSKLDGRGLALDFRTLTDDLPEIKKVQQYETQNYIVSYCCTAPINIIIKQPNELFDILSPEKKNNE